MKPGFQATIALYLLLKLLALGSWCDECITIYFKTSSLATWQRFYSPTDPKINPQLCLDMIYPAVKFHVDWSKETQTGVEILFFWHCPFGQVPPKICLPESTGNTDCPTRASAIEKSTCLKVYALFQTFIFLYVFWPEKASLSLKMKESMCSINCFSDISTGLYLFF